jgi:hypothetical protein
VLSVDIAQLFGTIARWGNAGVTKGRGLGVHPAGSWLMRRQIIISQGVVAPAAWPHDIATYRRRDRWRRRGDRVAIGLAGAGPDVCNQWGYPPPLHPVRVVVEGVSTCKFSNPTQHLLTF